MSGRSFLDSKNDYFLSSKTLMLSQAEQKQMSRRKLEMQVWSIGFGRIGTKEFEPHVEEALRILNTMLI